VFYPLFTFTAFQNVEVCFDANSKAQNNQSTFGANRVKHMPIKYTGCLLLEKTFVIISFYIKNCPLRKKAKKVKIHLNSIHEGLAITWKYLFYRATDEIKRQDTILIKSITVPSKLNFPSCVVAYRTAQSGLRIQL
jgi:hypothetical protein